MSSLASPLRLGDPGTATQPPAYLSEKYEFGKRLGGGAFGDVWLAREREGARALRAIKHIKRKYNRWEECLKLRECKALSSLPPHLNVVRLFQLIHAKPQLDLYFVMEYCPRDLHQLTTARRSHGTAFDVQEVAALGFDLLSALQHLHRHGFFHRDIKPENLLVSAAPPRNNTEHFGKHLNLNLPPELSIGALKLADFGQTREIRSRPPFTDYVSTRWYRAPEVLEGGGLYNSPVDIWGAGCVIGELMTCGTPIFPGQSVLQQLAMVRIARARAEDVKADDMVGLPSGNSPDEWHPQGLQASSTSGEGLDLLRSLLQYNQRARPNTGAALAHPFFDECRSQASATAASVSNRKAPCDTSQASSRHTKGSAVLPDIFENAAPDALSASSSAAQRPAASTRMIHSPSRQQAPTNDRVSQLLEEAGIMSPKVSDSTKTLSTPTAGEGNRSALRARTSSEHILRKAFNKYDRKGTGFIDAHDVSRILIKLGEFSNEGTSSMGKKKECNEVDSLTLMAAEAEVALADRSARGKLSYEDFVAWFTNRVPNKSEMLTSEGGEGSSSSSSLPVFDSVSARVAAARTLLMQSWDGSPSSPKIVSPTRPSGSAPRSPSRFRHRVSASPSAAALPKAQARGVLQMSQPTRQLTEILDKETNGKDSTDRILIANGIKRGVPQHVGTQNKSEDDQENQNREDRLDGSRNHQPDEVVKDAHTLSSPLALFQKFDTSKSGFLSREQFSKMMMHLGLSFSTDDDLLVDAEMAMLADEKDRVSFEQWKGWYSNLPSE